MRRILTGMTCIAVLMWATNYATAAPVFDEPAGAAATFEKIKSLEGEWVHEVDGEVQTVSRIQIVAGGSAVMETLFPGTDLEMISMYHIDGDRVLLNHYCMLGNQPRFEAVMNQESNVIEFKFLDATGLNTPGEMHIHHGRVEWVGPDQLRSAWTPYENGKAVDPHAFELRRVQRETTTSTSSNPGKSCCSGGKK